MQARHCVFRHDLDSKATKSPGAYLLKCVEVLLHLGRGRKRGVVDELLSNYQRVGFNFPTFCEVLRTCKHFSQIISKRSDDDLMHAGSARNHFHVETVERNCRTVLYKKIIENIFRKQLLLACRNDATFCRCQNGRGAVCPENSKGF